jgi:outer membrane protein OmpA-like peptidoglycan-associated protein/opacity protein-like surface antigen
MIFAATTWIISRQSPEVRNFGPIYAVVTPVTSFIALMKRVFIKRLFGGTMIQSLRHYAVRTLILVILLLAGRSAMAQSAGGRVAFGAHGGLSKYWGSFTDNQFWYGGDLFLRYNIVPSLSFHAQFGINQLRYKVNQQNLLDHPEYFGAPNATVYPGTTINREEKNTIRVNTYSGLLSWNISPSQKLVPYIFAGLGLMNFEPRNMNQNVGLPNNQAGVYKKQQLVFPMGVGVEMYLTNNLTLNAKGQVFLTQTDYLDDFSEAGTSNDAFATFGLGLSYYIFGSLDCDKDGLTDSEEETLGTDKCNPDTDGDGLTDFEEVRTYGTDPKSPDTDKDGLKDFEEIRTYTTDPRNPDTDSDGLNDGQEVARKTDPKNADTDGDGLADGDEVNRYGTNPKVMDTDGDGLKDGEEVSQYKTDPKNPDSDSDGLKDGDEVKNYKTNPTNRDTDNDKLSDGDEVLKVHSNPLNPDTDGDTVIDGDDACPLIAGVPERNGCPAPPKVGTITSFPAIYFIVDTDQFDFSRPETDENLAKMLSYVNQCPGLGVVVEGHASREGSEKRNQQLSDMRARRVKSWLIEHGVDSNKVEATIGYGSRQNAVPEPDPKSAVAKKMKPEDLEAIRKQNRRIAIKVVHSCD